MPGGLWPEELALLDELPDAPVVFDVGANVGDYTAAALARRPAALVFPFEAQETARRAFESRHPFVPIWGALGAAVERRMLWSDAPRSELGSFYTRPALPPIKEQPVGEITVWPLTELWIEFGIERVDLMKIDVEGAELEVLRGAAPLLDRFDAITFEFITGITRYVDQSLGEFEELLGDFTIERLQTQGEVTYLARRK